MLNRQIHLHPAILMVATESSIYFSVATPPAPPPPPPPPPQWNYPPPPNWGPPPGPNWTHGPPPAPHFHTYTFPQNPPAPAPFAYPYPQHQPPPYTPYTPAQKKTNLADNLDIMNNVVSIMMTLFGLSN
ncbi:hypothetical protein D9619_002561 [Psilocybe cf. subviscida]|uniref:Uncharacterized protein n=1 Tax=Psilocybe cf. subviscida TaxID=2480587 RepID=A0A8H5AX39_9AGAR|nr:hypothetical protein D9619_002561 [Psilocybe cf. subviscida]